MAERGVGSEAGGESGRETPASEGYPETRRDVDGDTEMSDTREGVQGVEVKGEAGHRRTDHERHGSSEESATKTPVNVPALLKLHTTRKCSLQCGM